MKVLSKFLAKLHLLQDVFPFCLANEIFGRKISKFLNFLPKKPGQLKKILPSSHNTCLISSLTIFILDTDNISEEPDEMPLNAAFHLGLHYLLLKIRLVFRDRNTCTSF